MANGRLDNVKIAVGRNFALRTLARPQERQAHKMKRRAEARLSVHRPVSWWLRTPS